MKDKTTKDWTGNANSLFKTLGASNHTDKIREANDYYATEPAAAEWLLKLLDMNKTTPIWECASGEDHLANVFKSHGYTVRTSDIIKRTGTTEQLDFLSPDIVSWNGHIITNPPYKYATEFVEKALSIIEPGNYVCMFLKIQFLEGKRRQELFKKNPPRTVFVSSSRLQCAKNADFEGMKEGGGSAVAYAWFVWQKGYIGDTIIKWFN